VIFILTINIMLLWTLAIYGVKKTRNLQNH
jgi:hypothetical protein